MKTKFLLILTLLATMFASCTKPQNDGPDTPPTPEEPPVDTRILELTADKNQLLGNGIETATFTITLINGEDSEDVTNQAVISEKNLGEIEGNTFSIDTEEGGTYTFTASFSGVTSNEVEITVAPYITSLTLSVDKTEISGDLTEKATFTIIFNDNGSESDVSKQAIIYDQTDTPITGNTFSTSISGTYTFYAKYQEVISNTVDLVVKEVETPPAGNYAIGDLYDKDGVQGVVFRVPTAEKPGLIISLTESQQAWSNENVWVNCGFAKGEFNCEMIYMQENWEEKYPAAKWCYDLGDGWFLPSDSEFAEFWLAFNGALNGDNKDKQEIFNSKFTDEIFVGNTYWTSNEISEDMATAYVLDDPNDVVICLNPFKYEVYHVRAAKYIY